MLSEYDFTSISYAYTTGVCIACGDGFEDGFVYSEGQVCSRCKDIILAVDTDDDVWLDNLIEAEEQRERELREFYDMMGYDEAEGYIATCQGCGAYGYRGLTCNRTEFCGEYI